jgi:2-polyprenyl-3-methyl-5-hydroxy-6-metoxy-1,4-benzoquinol methylase
MAVDRAKLDALMKSVNQYMTGTAMCYGIWLGDELGLYGAMVGAGPLTAAALARRTSCNERLVREWLDSQAAGGLLTFDADTDRYELGEESALALADDTSPMFVARGMSAFASLFIDVDKVTGAFRGDGGLSWSEHDPRLFAGTEWFFRTGYRTFLPGWILALDGVAAKLQAGARIADVGCGHGVTSIVLAQSYPKSRVVGFDFHAPSIETARARATEAGVDERAEFAVAGATDYRGTFDLICFFDCLHDMGDPVGIARHAREHLAHDGTVMLVEPFAIDGRAANINENPKAALLYLVSSAVCTPNALSQDAELALGAQAGEAMLQQVFQDAGFTRFRRAAETPLNLVLEARA